MTISRPSSGLNAAIILLSRPSTGTGSPDLIRRTASSLAPSDLIPASIKPDLPTVSATVRSPDAPGSALSIWPQTVSEQTTRTSSASDLPATLRISPSASE